MEENSYYSVAAISNSSLSVINPEQGGTPKRFKKYIIDREVEVEETPSLKNGKIIHKYVECPDNFIVSEIEKPSEMMASWVEIVKQGVSPGLVISDVKKDNEFLKQVALHVREDRYKNISNEDTAWDKFCKEGFYYLMFLIKGEGKIIMDLPTKTIVEGAIQGIKDNSLANQMLLGEKEHFDSVIYNELAIYWKEEKYDLDCKALLDRVVINPSDKTVQLIDLKTTSKAGTLIGKSFRDYRYYRQLAYYKHALIQFLSKEFPEIDSSLWEIDCYIISVETFGLFECHVHLVDNLWLVEGQKEFNNLLKRVGYHFFKNDWELSFEEKQNKGKLILEYVEK